MKMDEAIQKLVQTDKVWIGNHLFKIKDVVKTGDNFKCELVQERRGKSTIYSHVKEAKNKKDAIAYALEHVRTMGYDLEN